MSRDEHRPDSVPLDQVGVDVAVSGKETDIASQVTESIRDSGAGSEKPIACSLERRGVFVVDVEDHRSILHDPSTEHTRSLAGAGRPGMPEAANADGSTPAETSSVGGAPPRPDPHITTRHEGRQANNRVTDRLIRKAMPCDADAHVALRRSSDRVEGLLERWTVKIDRQPEGPLSAD